MALDLRQLKDEAQTDPVATEPLGREHQFTVSYASPDGKNHKDDLVSKIMDGDERVLVARIAARRAGVPWEHMPATHAARIWAIATIAVQLRDPPDWVSKWVMEDDTLLFSIFDVLQTHDSFFFRGDRSESSEDAEKPRVAVHTSLATRTAEKP